MSLRSDTFIPLLRSNDPSLFELTFSGKYPTGATLRLVGDALRRNTALKRLDLSNCQLQDTDVVPLIELLGDNVGLLRLDLRNNPDLSSSTGQALLTCVIDRNSTLSHVVLDGTGIPEETVESITFLMTLNKFPSQLKPQAHRARNNDESFFALELTHDPSDVKVYNEESARMITECLRYNTVVRSLKLNRCCVGEHSMRELRPIFQYNFTLRRVSLQQNYLNSESALMIVAALERAGENSSLEDLDLSLNEIDDVGCDKFTELLRVNATLRVVSLLRNRCSQVALDRLRTACALNCEPAQLKPIIPRLLANDPELHKIEMCGVADVGLRGPGRGYFTSLGAATLSEALLHNTQLHTLVLAYNHIGPDGAKALASLVARTKSLTALDLTSNPINDEGARYLIMALRQNDSLVELVVDSCNVSVKSAQEIAALCHINCQPLPLKEYLLDPDSVPQGNLDLSYRLTQPRGKWRSLFAESMPYVVSILQKNRAITEINLTDNVTLGDDGILQLAAVLREPACQLTKLVLSNTSITDVAVRGLYDSLMVNYVVKSMVLSPNAGTTAKTRQNLEDLIELNHFPPAVKDLITPLSMNVDGIVAVSFVRQADEQPYGDDAVRVIAKALRDNTKVSTVRFSSHRVSNRGIGYLSELLLHNTSITELDLSHNDVGMDGVSELALMLEQNNTLHRVLLDDNPLTEPGGVLLLKSLQTANRTVTAIGVSGCRLLPQTQMRIEAQVAANGQPLYFRTYVLDRLSATPALQFPGDVSTGFLDKSSVSALLLGIGCQPNGAVHIHTISFPHNKFEDSCISDWEEVAKALPNLTLLDLSYNPFTPASAEAFANVCRAGRALQRLVLPPSVPTDAFRDILAVHAQPAMFQQAYQKLEDALHRRRRADAPTKMVLELASLTLTPAAVTLLVNLLQQNHAIGAVRAFSLTDCDVHDPAWQSWLDALMMGGGFAATTGVDGVQLVRSPISGTAADRLIQFVQQSRTVVCNVDEQSVANAELVTALREAVAANRAARAITHVESMFANPQANVAKASSRKIGLMKPSTSAPAALEYSAEEEAAVQQSILDDALRQMPPRAAYKRGMYSSSTR